MITGKNIHLMKFITAKCYYQLFFAFTLCILLNYTGFAQEKEYPLLDSLIKESEKISKTDVDSAINFLQLQIINYNGAHPRIAKFGFIKKKLDYYFIKSQFDEIRQSFAVADAEYKQLKLTFAKEHHSKIDLIWFGYLSVMANTNSFQGYLDSALLYNERAISLADQLESEVNKAVAMQNASIIYYRQGKLARSLEINQQVAEIYLRNEQFVSYCNTLGNIGTLQRVLGNIPETVNAYQKLAKVAEDKGLKANLGIAWSGLAMLYYAQEDYEESKKYNLKSIEIFTEMGRERQLAMAYSNIGDIYRKDKAIDSADYFYQKSIAIHKEIKLLDYQAYVLERIGTMYLEKGDLEKGLNYIDEGIAIVEQINSPEDELLLYSAKANGLLLKGLAKEAVAPIERSIRIAEETEDRSYKSDVYEIAHEIYQSLGNHKKAYNYLLSYMMNRDSIKNEDQVRALSKAEYEYALKAEKEKLDRERKEEELIYQADLARQKVIAYAIGLVLLIVLITVVLLIRSSKAKAKLNAELKQSNTLLSAVNNKLHQLDQFKTRLFANINHDFRTPITLISGYITRIKSNSDNYLTHESQSDLENLQHNAETLTDMTNEIQDLLLLEESKLKLTYSRVELTEYLHRQNKMFSSMADLTGIDLSCESAIEGELPVHLDLKHFEKIFYNLISNAFRYTEKGGSIAVSLASKDETAIIKISDTGKGIDPKDLPYIFDRFYQSPLNEYRSKEGFGIGLAVVKELIELHGGTISVISEPGSGTEFKIRLPFNHDKSIDSEPQMQEPETIRTLPVKKASSTLLSTEDADKPTVLVVDDHEEIRTYITSLISNLYDTREASNGKEALKLLEKNHIDLILTDLMMPWLDGYDFIEQLKQNERLSRIPVMVVSARTTEDDKHRVLDAGVNEFLSKPFDPLELQKRIQNLLSESKKRSNFWDQVAGNQETQSNLEQNIIKKLNQIIIDHISDPALNTDMIADELSASRSKAVRLIKSLTSQTPLGYIKEIRMNYVNDLIKSKKIRNATEAANAIGMKNVTYFTRQYKTHFGEPPQYLKD